MATVVGLFDGGAQAQEAVQRLRSLGVADQDISVALQAAGADSSDSPKASDSTAVTARGAVAGGLLGGIAGFVLGLGMVVIPGVGSLAVGGPLLTTLVGAGVGAATGGLVGALTNAGVPEDEALAYEAGVRRGGVLVTARVADGLETDAKDIMNNSNARKPTEMLSPPAIPPEALNPAAHSDTNADTLSGIGVLGSGAIGGPAGFTARAAAIGSSNEIIEENKGGGQE